MKVKVAKTLATLALSATMATCVGLAINHANFNAPVLASAETTQSAVTQTNIFTKDNITVTQNESQSVSLEGVEAGQYSLTLTQTPKPVYPPYDPDDPSTWREYFDIIVTVNGQTIFMSESSSDEGVYYGVINVKENDTLEISTTSSQAITFNLSVDTLFLNAGNNLTLSNIILPATGSVAIDILDSSVSSYTVVVDTGLERLDGRLTATIDTTNVALVEEEMQGTYRYSATISLDEETTELVNRTLTLIMTGNSESVSATISLVELSNVIDVKNNTAEATVNMWETAVFSYTADTTGYKTVTIAPRGNATAVETTVSVGTTAGMFNGTPVAGDNYPIYVEEGQTYYIEVNLVGRTPATYEDETGEHEYTDATFSITIGNWQKPTITADGLYAVPATPDTQTAHEDIDLSVNENNYDLSLADVPYEFYMNGVVIKAYINGIANPIELNADNGYSGRVIITDNNDETEGALVNTKIYFTTSQTTTSIVTVSLTVHEEIEYIPLNEAYSVTIPAKPEGADYGSKIYYLENAQAGIYSISLSAANSSVSVYADELSVIPEGKMAGGFVVRYDGSDYAIEFRNSSTEDINIYVTVESDDTAMLQLGDNSLSLTATQRRSYFMYSLAAGSYEVEVSNSAIELSVDGVPVTLTDGKATITISDIQDSNGVVNFTFENTTSASVDFKFTVNPHNTLEVNSTITVETSGYYYYTSYYAHVTAGQSYALTLNLPEGMSVTVTQNGTDLIYYDGYVGAFTAESTGYVTLRFSCYTYGDNTSFTAHFSTANAMPINTTTNVTISENNDTANYVAYLYPGTYKLNLSNPDVKVLINSVEITGNEFEVYLYSGVTISFIHTGSVTFTATLVPNNILAVGANSITLTAWNSATYYINLEQSVYNLALTLDENVHVQVLLDGQVVISDGATSAVLNITASGYHALTFINEGGDDITFSANVIPQNMLVINEENNITIEAGAHSKAYYIDLQAGSYNIALTLPEGINVQVTVNNIVVENYGTFTISEDQAGYVRVVFTTESDAAVDFTVYIYAAS